MSTVSHQNLKIDLEPDPLGVGGIFLHGWIHNETAVRKSVNPFCSIPTFHGETNRFSARNVAFWGPADPHKKHTKCNTARGSEFSWAFALGSRAIFALERHSPSFREI